MAAADPATMTHNPDGGPTEHCIASYRLATLIEHTQTLLADGSLDGLVIRRITDALEPVLLRHQMWLRQRLAEAEAPYRDLDDQLVASLLAALRGGGEMSLTQIHALLWRNRSAADIHAALTSVRRLGEATMRKVRGRGKKPVELWRATPPRDSNPPPRQILRGFPPEWDDTPPPVPARGPRWS